MASACNICADNLFVVTRDISALSCGHTFHRTCLSRWWTVKKECPSCRKVCKGKIDKLYFENFDVAINGLKLKVDDLKKTVKAREKSQQAMEGILKRKLCDSRVQVANFKTSVQEQEKQIFNLLAQNAAIVKELSQVAGKKSVTDDEVRRHRNVNTGLESQLGNVQAEARKLKEEYECLRAENVKQKQQLQMTEQKLTKLQSERPQKMERVTKIEDELKHQVNSASLENAVLKVELSKRNSQIKDLNHQLRDLQTKNKAVPELQRENCALQSKFTKVHDQLLRSKASNMLQMKMARDQHIKFTQRQRDELTARLGSAETENQKLKLALTSTDFENSSLKKELDNYKSMIQDLELQLAEVKERKTTMPELQEKVELHTTLLNVESELQRFKEKELTQLDTTITQCSRIAKDYHDELQTNLVSAEAEIASLRSELASTSDAPEKSHSQLYVFDQNVVNAVPELFDVNFRNTSSPGESFEASDDIQETRPDLAVTSHPTLFRSLFSKCQAVAMQPWNYLATILITPLSERLRLPTGRHF